MNIETATKAGELLQKIKSLSDTIDGLKKTQAFSSIIFHGSDNKERKSTFTIDDTTFVQALRDRLRDYLNSEILVLKKQLESL